MRKIITIPCAILMAAMFTVLAGGCARYARSVNVLYEPSTTIHGGKEEVYVVIPEEPQPRSTGMRWVIGTVSDGSKRQIDELLSARSPEEIIRAALVQELKRAGYSVSAPAKRPENGQWVVDLTKAEVELDQISGFATMEVKCRVKAGMEVFRDGRLIKRLQYEAASSRTDLRDRDRLAATVLRDALGEIMLKAVPDLHGLFGP
jgi:hypothetical protein